MNTLATRDIILATLVIVLGASGTYLLLPHSHGRLKPLRAHVTGGVLAGLSILFLALFWTPPGPFLTNLFFYAFGIAAIAGGVLTITSRSPIQSALWFASVILSTSGLFLLSGAQFLAAGTVIVYAGAIIVTFLFVIMLAQSQGQAMYDRTARAPGRATFGCFVLFWGLLYALLMAQVPPQPNTLIDTGGERRLVRTTEIANVVAKSTAEVLARAVRPTAQIGPQVAHDGVPPPHVAGLGGTLYTDHLLSAELTGVLLFVALIGALVIAAPRAGKVQPRPATGTEHT